VPLNSPQAQNSKDAMRNSLKHLNDFPEMERGMEQSPPEGLCALSVVRVSILRRSRVRRFCGSFSCPVRLPNSVKPTNNF